jgi:collagenase-like PrtC family protease
MAIRQHKADEWDAKQMERAVAYTASIFYNGKNNSLRFATRQEAEDMARRMRLAAANGRKGMVYAILPEGNALFVSSH